MTKPVSIPNTFALNPATCRRTSAIGTALAVPSSETGVLEGLQFTGNSVAVSALLPHLEGN
jgi:hypothetical protein